MARSERGASLGARALVVAGALSVTPSCGREPAASRSDPAQTARADPADASADVLWHGCDQIRLPADERRPMICVLLTRVETDSVPRLRLWVPSSVSEPRVTLDGQDLDLEDQEPVDSGLSFIIRPKHSGQLELTDHGEDGPARLLRLKLQLRPRQGSELKAQLDAAMGKPEVQRELERRWAEARANAGSWEQRLLYTRYLQHVTFDRGRWRQSAELAMEMAALARVHGLALTECRSTWVAAFLYGQPLGDNEQALRVLENSCDHASSIPEAVMKRSYYGGGAQLYLGRLGDARRSIERAFDIARRLRLHNWERISIHPLVEALAEQGRFEWARSMLERSRELAEVAEDTSPLERCELSTFYDDGRAELAFREARLTGRSETEAREHWERVAEIYSDRKRCPDHSTIDAGTALTETKLARLDLDEGRLDDAARRLDAVDPRHLGSLFALRARLLRAELWLARGAEPRASDLLDELAEPIEGSEHAPAAPPQERWRYLHLRARLHQARGDPRRAIDVLARAQRELEVGMGMLAAGVETDRYMAMRREGGQLLVRLLLDQGLVQPALCAARINRARVQGGPRRDRGPLAPTTGRKGLDRYAWFDPRDIPVDELLTIESGLDELMSLPSEDTAPVRCEELPTPVEGEVALLPFNDGQRWVGFMWNHRAEVIVRPLAGDPGDHDPAALGHALLSPFEDWLGASHRLRVLIPPDLHDVSVPDLLWNGQPVGNQMTVASSVDRPPTAAPSPAPSTAALIFSDPRQRLLGDESSLSEHFERWARHLRDNGVEIAFDRSPAAAHGQVSIDDVLRGTEGAGLALLYGFGAPRRSRYDLLAPGTRGEDADLNTFDLGTTGLLRGDVLRLAGRAPRHMILAHCDSATIDPYGISGAVGLAQSYVQAGSEWAVGTVGTVDPETMKIVVDELIDAYPGDSSVDRVAQALRSVKRRLRDKGLPDGEKLRLWIP